MSVIITERVITSDLRELHMRQGEIMQSFFVSSTFKDMQGERDALHRVVIPRLREKAADYGESIQFVDLRWGIPTTDMDSDASAGKILGVCLDEIRQCNPYMIVLLGERYGWMPSPELLKNAANEMDFSMESYEMSVTELEIQYGIWLAKGQLDHCIFCMREPVPVQRLTEDVRRIYQPGSQEDRIRMQQLKEKIYANQSAAIPCYSLEWDEEMQELSGYDRFADRLSDTLEKLMAPFWNTRKNLSPQERQREDDRLLIERHLASFVGRGRELSEVICKIKNHAIVILEGEGGCGKSAFMAKLSQLMQEQGYLTEMFCCGNSAACMNTEQLIRLMCWQIMQMALEGRAGEKIKDAFELMPKENDKAARWRDFYNLLLVKYDGPELIFFLDAIDQLVPDRELYESWFIPIYLTPKCKIVVSTTGAVQVNPLSIPSRKVKIATTTYRLLPPSEAELWEILETRFRMEHKQVSSQVAQKILENPCSRNMLGMEIIIRRLTMLNQKDFQIIASLEQCMDGNEAIDTYLMLLLKNQKTSLNELIIDYLDTVPWFLDDKRGDVMHLLLYIIAILQHGISAEQLEQMSEFIRDKELIAEKDTHHTWNHLWDPILFARLKRYLGDFLIQRNDGRVDYSHRLLREALLSRQGIDGIAYIPRCWLYFQSGKQNIRQENILPLTRMIVASERTLDESFRMDDWFSNTIISAWKMAESTDKPEAVEGKRQVELLKQSILSDLKGENGEKHLDTYCFMLDQIIMDGAGPGNIIVWFFRGIVLELDSRHGTRTTFHALQIMCRILASLYTQKQLYEAGNDKYLINWWSADNRKRLLDFYATALKMYQKLQLSCNQGITEIRENYGYDSQTIFDQAIKEADACIAKYPDTLDFYIAKAELYTYLASQSVSRSFGIRQSDVEKYVDAAMKYTWKMLEFSKQKSDDRHKYLAREWTLSLSSICIETLITHYNNQVFKPARVLERAFDIYRSVQKEVPKNEISEKYVIYCSAMFLNAAGRLLRCLASKNKRQREAFREKAANMCFDYYYSIYENKPRITKPEDRTETAKLAITIGHLVADGSLPHTMKECGYNRRDTLRYIISHEEGYILSQGIGDLEGRYQVAQLQYIKAFYHGTVRPKECVECCNQAIEELKKIQKENRQLSGATSFSELDIINEISCLESIRDKNRQLL